MSQSQLGKDHIEGVCQVLSTFLPKEAGGWISCAHDLSQGLVCEVARFVGVDGLLMLLFCLLDHIQDFVAGVQVVLEKFWKELEDTSED